MCNNGPVSFISFSFSLFLEQRISSYAKSDFRNFAPYKIPNCKVSQSFSILTVSIFCLYDLTALSRLPNFAEMVCQLIYEDNLKYFEISVKRSV